MSSFFTGGPRERPLFPVPEQELYAFNGRHWTDPPREYIVPAVLPWAQPLGRSERTVVALRAIEVWPQALTLRVTVYSRDSLVDDPAEGLIDHRRKPDYNGLLIGVLYADGSRASSETISVPSASEPEAPVLRATPVGGTRFAVEHEIFLWPLPSAGPLKLVVQWTDREIPETRTTLDGGAIRAAAKDAAEIWPGLGKRQVNGLPVRRVGKQVALTPDWGTPVARVEEPGHAPGE
ncbi:MULTISPECIES: hypothetical protein [Amycolatopsis]|uniref:Acetoacetate decarboxylase n=1 Tax=Amycolatopsis bullii TaxID=941987 RepID=A0ABQ3KC75_9PSEU|nr:hypothetical protein [Amycolatopsis bullii]GHG13299.1 hypothetical protein GCM10017567_33530 [Amycolatopsis bullii]